jgi:hypothetical protein
MDDSKSTIPLGLVIISHAARAGFGPSLSLQRHCLKILSNWLSKSGCSLRDRSQEGICSALFHGSLDYSPMEYLETEEYKNI